MRRAAVVALLTLAACHGPIDVRNETAGDPAAPPWTRGPDVAARVTTVAEVAAETWGGHLSDLDGWTVVLSMQTSDGAIGRCSPDAVVGGGTIHVDVRAYPSMCLESSVLAHEIGHVIIGDGDHEDRRWCDTVFWEKMARALAARVSPDEGACRADLLFPDRMWHRLSTCRHR